MMQSTIEFKYLETGGLSILKFVAAPFTNTEVLLINQTEELILSGLYTTP